MKIRTLLMAAAAVLAASCTSKTTITGTVAEGVDSVRVYVRDIEMQKAVAAVDHQFEVSLPVDEVAVGTIVIGQEQMPFILDGSALTVAVQEDGSYQYKAADEASANALIFDFYGKVLLQINEMNALTMQWYQSGADRESDTYNQLLARQESITSQIKEFVDAHLTSAAILPVLRDFNAFDEEEMAELIEKMAPALKENKFIQSSIKQMEAVEATKEGKMFVDFTIPDSDGKEVRLSDYVGKGKYVLVDFWASWCGPCRGEIPNLIKVYDKYHGENFDVLGVAVWDKPEDSKKAAEQMGINYSEIINGQNIPTDAYGINGIPQIILFGPDGTILKRDLRGEAIEAEIAKYVQPAE